MISITCIVGVSNDISVSRNDYNLKFDCQPDEPLWLLWWPPTGSSNVYVMFLMYSVLHCLYSVGNKITTVLLLLMQVCFYLLSLMFRTCRVKYINVLFSSPQFLRVSSSQPVSSTWRLCPVYSRPTKSWTPCGMTSCISLSRSFRPICTRSRSLVCLVFLFLLATLLFQLETWGPRQWKGTHSLYFVSWVIKCALTHCDLATPYGDRDLSQHWLR